MKRRDVTKLHSNTIGELTALLEEFQKNLVKEKMGIKIGSQKNTSAATNIRRDIARVKTILHSKRMIEETKEIKKGK